MADFILISVTCSPELSEILMAELGECGFSSFQENDEGFQGAVEISLHDAQLIKSVFQKYTDLGITWKESQVNKENWNKKWEENYDPVIVDDSLIVRATFHKVEKHFPYEIIINPKMSFGTGHHETTWLILKNELNLQMKGKAVLDVGCGTGILGILASKLGARRIVGFDVEEWAVKNAKENFKLNNVNGEIIQGSIEKVPAEKFDIILANINKNVLLEQIPVYANLLNDKGKLLISGFYEEDFEDLLEEAEKAGLKKIKSMTRNDWALMIFSK